MWLVSVTDVMATNIICLSKSCERRQLTQLIQRCDTGDCAHNAFPVIDHVERGRRKLRGIITLDDIRKAVVAEGRNEKAKRLKKVLAMKSPRAAVAKKRNGFDEEIPLRRDGDERQTRGDDPEQASSDEDEDQDEGSHIMQLLDFADRSPITTVPHAKVARAFDMFRKVHSAVLTWLSTPVPHAFPHVSSHAHPSFS